MSQSRILYWGSGSTPCWRAMIVLAEKGLEYESKLISFDKKEHKGKEVTDLNARGQVPTFKDGQIIVNESGAICDYLENRYPDKKLIPSSPEEFGKVFQRKYEIQNLEKKLMPDFLYYFWMNRDNIDKEKVAEKEKALREELIIWEGYLKGNKFIAGNDFTMADVFLFPLIAWGFRLGLNGEKYPNLHKYYKECCERKSIKDTWPPHWKEGDPQPPAKDVCKNL